MTTQMPEPFNGRPVGRLRGDGALVVVRKGELLNVNVTVLDAATHAETLERRTVHRRDVEPLTKAARTVLQAEPEGEIREKAAIAGNKDAVRRTRE